jgi:predicted Fe-Mo cluster-binding NifX family protein
MRIAVSATAPELNADIDPRFGRCQYFVIVDTETMDLEGIENPSAAASGGAGISAAQMITDKGVEAVLTGNYGPNAYQVLAAAGVKVITGATGKVKDAVEGYKSGKYQSSSQPSTGAKSGMGGGMGRGRGGNI